ncbi:hypothetical protein HPB48_026511 [Haemaphysalis longicornis]|uniref:Uncharacterized protein n=1 Tax=Haemaphysalis longicornis TaxID=44386 RepID=A0A9J6H1A7_HAELO|nr:hypothetical protein HPB48_026511 [Haemaphysalis longicornis]
MEVAGDEEEEEASDAPKKKPRKSTKVHLEVQLEKLTATVAALTTVTEQKAGTAEQRRRPRIRNCSVGFICVPSIVIEIDGPLAVDGNSGLALQRHQPFSGARFRPVPARSNLPLSLAHRQRRQLLSANSDSDAPRYLATKNHYRHQGSASTIYCTGHRVSVGARHRNERGHSPSVPTAG